MLTTIHICLVSQDYVLGIKESQLVKIGSAVNGFYSQEIKNEQLARFIAKMLPSIADNIPIQFWDKNQKMTRNDIYHDMKMHSN